jgi:hypothetical protein
MAVETREAPASGRCLVRNIGRLLTGDVAAPLADSDCLMIEDGVIAGFEAGDADREIDAGGCAVAPGLIDSHCHPVFGDWTPRQNQLGWIEMNVNGGVTSFLSAGEVHLPGRPKDAEGVKALAMVAQRCFQNFRPIGAKVIAGAPVPELDFDRDFYAGLKAAGIRHIGEIGLGTVAKGAGRRPRHRLVPRDRDRDDHAHGRAVHRRLAPCHRRGRAGGAARRGQPHQRRADLDRACRYPRALPPCDGRARGRAQRQREVGAGGSRRRWRRIGSRIS